MPSNNPAQRLLDMIENIDTAQLWQTVQRDSTQLKKVAAEELDRLAP